MRLFDDFTYTTSEMNRMTSSYKKLKKKLDYKSLVEDGGVRRVVHYPNHTTMYAEGYIKPEYRHRIVESDLALLALGAYPDFGGNCQIYPDNYFILELNYNEKSVELKKQPDYKRVALRRPVS